MSATVREVARARLPKKVLPWPPRAGALGATSSTVDVMPRTTNRSDLIPRSTSPSRRR